MPERRKENVNSVSVAGGTSASWWRHLWALGWILRCYVNRPLAWAILSLGALAAVGDFFYSRVPESWQRDYPDPRPHRLNIYDPAAAAEAIATGRAGEVDGIQLSSIWYRTIQGPPEKAAPGAPPVPRALTESEAAGPGEEFYRILDDFPQLRHVEYTAFSDHTGFDRVARVPGLEYLTLYSIEPLDLTPLRQATRLRWIDLQTSKPPRNLAALADLPHLETIVVRSRMAIDDALLGEIADLPHLKTLVLDFAYYSPHEPRLSKAGLAQLAKAPALTTIFTGGRPEGAELLASVRAALPGMDVRPAVGRLKFWARDSIHLLPVVAFAAVVGIQLSSQMRSPLRCVAPRFIEWHLGVGLTLCGLLIGLGACRLMGSGAFALAAWGTAAAMVLSVVGAMVLNFLGAALVRPKVAKPAMIATAVLWGVMAITIVPDWADALLREQNRILTALVWLGAIACGLLVFWMLGQLIYWSTSTSDRATTMGWSQAPLQTAYRESWWIAPRAQEERIEQWRSMRPAAWTRWQRIDRWRAGNLPARTIPVALVMGAVIVGLQAVGMTAVRPGTFALSSSLSLAGLLILALTTQQVGMIWRTRLAVLPLELTRPVARGALVREWMTAFLMDLLPGVTIAAATGAVGLMLAQANSGRATGWGWALSGYFVYLFPLAAVMAAGLGGVVVLVERAWLAITLCWGFVYVALMALMVASIAWSTATHGSTLRGMPSIPVELLWAPPLCAAVLAVFMVRRFAMMEVGRRA